MGITVVTKGDKGIRRSNRPVVKSKGTWTFELAVDGMLERASSLIKWFYSPATRRLSFADRGRTTSRGASNRGVSRPQPEKTPMVPPMSCVANAISSSILSKLKSKIDPRIKGQSKKNMEPRHAPQFTATRSRDSTRQCRGKSFGDDWGYSSSGFLLAALLSSRA